MGIETEVTTAADVPGDSFPLAVSEFEAPEECGAEDEDAPSEESPPPAAAPAAVTVAVAVAVAVVTVLVTVQCDVAVASFPAASAPVTSNTCCTPRVSCVK